MKAHRDSRIEVQREVYAPAAVVRAILAGGWMYSAGSSARPGAVRSTTAGPRSAAASTTLGIWPAFMGDLTHSLELDPDRRLVVGPRVGRSARHTSTSPFRS